MKLHIGLLALSAVAMSCKPRNFNEATETLSGPNQRNGYSLGGVAQAERNIKASNLTKFENLGPTYGVAIVQSSRLFWPITSENPQTRGVNPTQVFIANLHGCTPLSILDKKLTGTGEYIRVAYALQTKDNVMINGERSFDFITGYVARKNLVMRPTPLIKATWGKDFDCDENMTLLKKNQALEKEKADRDYEQFKNNLAQAQNYVAQTATNLKKMSQDAQLQAVKTISKVSDGLQNLVMKCPADEKRLVCDWRNDKAFIHKKGGAEGTSLVPTTDIFLNNTILCIQMSFSDKEKKKVATKFVQNGKTFAKVLMEDQSIQYIDADDLRPMHESCPVKN